MSSPSFTFDLPWPLAAFISARRSLVLCTRPHLLSPTLSFAALEMALTRLSSSARASSPDSLGSGAMEESDSEREEELPARNSDVPYPLEGKYIDSRDKAKILAMSQLERETVLGQRAEEMNKANFQAEIARRAASMQNNSTRKRKADSDDDSAGQDTRKTKKTNSSLEAYKRDREQRGQQRQIRDDREDDRRRGRRRSSSADRDARSDVDAEGDSDVDWDEERKPVVREEQPAMLSHFEAVRVSRGFFSVVCFHPGFEEAMTGTFGRIGVGQDAQQKTLYKMAQIKGWLPPSTSLRNRLTMPQASLPANRTPSTARTGSALAQTSTSFASTAIPRKSTSSSICPTSALQT